MADLQQITDYSETTKNIIPSRFSGKPGFNGILEANDTQLNDLENANFQVFDEVWIDTAYGAQLDIVGGGIGLVRNGRDDGSYRSLIKLKIDINIGSGQPELLIKVIKQLYDASEVHYVADYPAGVIMQHNGSIGLFILTELEIDDGGFMLLDDGNPLYLREPDDTSADLLDLVIPSGVELTIVNI